MLRVLDLGTGRSTEVPAVAPAWTAAFASDSRRLAVQVGRRLHLLGLTATGAGAVTETVDLPADRQLVGNVGWSPDGALFALVPLLTDGQANGNTGHGMYLTESQSLTFVPTSGANRPLPPAVEVVQLLGWRSAGG